MSPRPKRWLPLGALCGRFNLFSGQLHMEPKDNILGICAAWVGVENVKGGRCGDPHPGNVGYGVYSKRKARIACIEWWR